jgi:dihydropteroate synthase
VPVLAAISRALPTTTLSVDTTSPEVAERALEVGASVVNDVSGLADPELARVVARRRAGLVVMHTRGAPATMQDDTRYADLVGEVEAFLRERAALARDLGVDPERLVVDPGVGFAKAPLDNPALVAAVPRLKRLGYPVLVGASRKGFVGRLTGVPRAEDRVAGSIGAALAAAALGADLLRVHDVKPTRDALVVYAACTSGARGAEGDGGD